jgi:hypothetical protein
MKRTIFSKARLLGQISGLGALSLMLGGCPGGGVVGAHYNANEKLGFPVTNSAVVIDGVANDAAWSKGFKFYLEDGASVSAAYMRGMSDADNLYMYFETEDPGGFDINDVVVLAFNPTNASNDYKRMLIYPCQDHPCVSAPGGFDPHVSYSSGSEAAGVVTWGALSDGLPPGVTVKANAAPNGMGGRWSVEVKIAKANYPFLANNFFGMFADVIATDPNLGPNGTAYQYTWPQGGYIGDDIFSNLNDAKLPLPRWGNVTLDTSLFPTGLQITGFGNIGVDPSAISLTGNNEFFATVANSPAGTGAEPDSTGVTANFKINNIGLNPQWTWTDIPSTTNPTSPPQTIKSREYMPFSSGDWPLLTTGNYQGSGLSQHDFFAAHLHQCVRVDVSYTGAVNPISRQYNMNFVAVNSPFDVESQIATGAWRKNFPRAQSVILQEQFLNGGSGFTWESKFGGAERIGPHRWLIGSLKDQTQMLRTSILAGPTLKLPSQQFKLDPVALSAGRTFDIPVHGGTVMTLLTDGEAVIKKKPYSAAGLSAEAAKRAEIKAETVPDGLRPGATTRVGALLGSFDDFRTTFQIGTGTTLFVPYNAQQLRLRIAKGVPFEGGGFALQVVMTEPNPVALDGASLESMRAAKGPVLLPLGINLPMHIVRGTLNTGMGVTIGKNKFSVGVPMGSYGSLVRSVRGSGPEVPPGPQVGRATDTLTVVPTGAISLPAKPVKR